MKDYLKLKKDKLLKLIRVGVGVVAEVSQWDKDSGKPITSLYIPIDVPTLTAEKAKLKADTADRVAEIDEILADAKKVK